MIIYFANRAMQIIGQASTALPGGLLASGDTKREEVDSGTASFDCYVEYAGKAERAKIEQMTAVGNYVLRAVGGEGEFYTILDSELDTDKGSMYIYAEDAGLDLLNEIVGEYSAASAMTIAQYAAIFTADSGFEIGVNEVSTYKRKLSWDGESTATARLQSLATQFDAELSFSYDIDRFHVRHKYINFWQKRGKETGATLRVGQHISSIRVKRSVANLATALLVEGGTPEGSSDPITLSGYSYDDGDFHVSGKYLMSREALAKWSRYVNPDETGTGLGHIVKRWSYDTTSQSELCTRAIRHLQQIREPEENYEVEIEELPEDVRIGDRVRIVDAEGELFLEARILVLESSEADQEYKATLGEYLLRDSGLSDQMAELARKINSISAVTAIVTVEEVSRDDSTGTATLRAVLRVNGEIVTPTSYNWTQGTSDTSLGTGETLTVTDLSATYNCTCEW